MNNSANRGERTAPRTYEVGEFRLDLENRVLQRRDGTLVPLTPRVFDTLLYFVQHAGRVLDKEVLMDAIWPNSIVEENNLSQNISKLRRVFGEAPGSHRYIDTVPGRGFRFVAPVKAGGSEAVAPRGTESRLEEPWAETGDIEPASSVVPESGSPLRLWRTLLFGAVILLVVAATFALWRARTHHARTTVKTLAVLPFKPLVPKDSDPILELGMADTLITKLGGSRGLIVRPLSTVRRYTAPEQDPVAAGLELRVEAVLDGSTKDGAI